MAVANQTPYKEYIGNGTTKIFPLEFDCDDADHLIVKVNDIEVPALNNWSLNTNTGSVVFANAPISQSKIILQRDTPLLRSTDYQTYNNSLRPQPVNNDFDKIWLKLQELGVTNWLTDTDIKNLSAYVNSLNEETRDDFFNKLGNLEQNTNAMLQEAIKNGAVSALAITTVSTVDELEALSVWDGRTVYVKNIGTFEYKTSQNAWQVSFNKAEFMIDESGQSQQEINNQIGAKLDSYYESSFSFGKRSKTTIKSKVNGVLSVDVERDGMPLAQSVTVPYVTTMQAYHSGKGEPFKQLMLPSDGFEDFNHSPSIIFGYDENDNLTPVMKGTNAAVGFDEFLRETEDQTALLTLRSFYSQSIKLPKNTDNTLSKYIKLVDINAGSLIYDVQFSATVAGSWDRERVASETTISVSNYQSIDWANASSYTADKWGDFIKVISSGPIGDRINVTTLRVGVVLNNNILSIYLIVPHNYMGMVRLNHINNVKENFISPRKLTFSSPAGLIELKRGVSLNSYNSGIASDGAVVMCDAHIRVAHSNNPSEVFREITVGNYKWIGFGTTNLPSTTNIYVQRIAVGTYRLFNIPGLWYGAMRIRQPSDQDGNQVAIASISGTEAVIYINEIKYQLNTTTNAITRTQGNLIDLPNNAWVDVFYAENWS
ncbi:hypothetical protein [Acinetobacter soli]|uniref:hypothetical protein n=1 Tax=Acinetobacter soli TaxID=487316 RepID=UPI0012317F68|nr:hypothetical protein [Acinetobacter soli]